MLFRSTIPKDVWYSPNRKQACLSTFLQVSKEHLVASTAEGLDVCTLTAELENMCSVLQQAQTLVAEANCLYSGVCQQQKFVYTPSMYSVTNREFVGTTMTSFYETYNIDYSFQIKAGSNQVRKI